MNHTLLGGLRINAMTFQQKMGLFDVCCRPSQVGQQLLHPMIELVVMGDAVPESVEAGQEVQHGQPGRWLDAFRKTVKPVYDLADVGGVVGLVASLVERQRELQIRRNGFNWHAWILASKPTARH